MFWFAILFLVGVILYLMALRSKRRRKKQEREKKERVTQEIIDSYRENDPALAQEIERRRERGQFVQYGDIGDVMIDMALRSHR